MEFLLAFKLVPLMTCLPLPSLFTALAVFSTLVQGLLLNFFDTTEVYIQLSVNQHLYMTKITLY